MAKCKIWDCDNKRMAWGWCDKHYRRFVKNKTTDFVGNSHLPLRERFHKGYIPVTETGCWLWEGANAGLKKYGVIVLNGKNLYAHRTSWMLHYGEIPKGILVLHKCDTPACVNPHHLFLGTPKDNIQDALKKGRLNYMPGVMASAAARRRNSRTCYTGER